MLAMTLRMVEQLTQCVVASHSSSRPGMIRALVDADVSGRPLPDAGLISTLFLLIGGGLDTTTSLLASSLRWLGDHVEDRRPLLDHPALIDRAPEELLRFYTPAQGGGRTVTQDCELAGHRFGERDRVFLSYAMCNHDPATFPDPDSVVLDRSPNRHAAFGMGVHRCIGSNIARVAFKTILTAVLRRLPDFRIDEGGIVQYESIGIINGYQHMPARFSPGSRAGSSLREVTERWQAKLDEQP